MEEIVEQLKVSENKLSEKIDDNNKINKDRYDFLKSQYDDLHKVLQYHTECIHDIQNKQESVHNTVNDLELELKTESAALPGTLRESVRGDFSKQITVVSAVITILSVLTMLIIFLIVDLNIFNIVK
jgi:hypothetical protein